MFRGGPRWTLLTVLALANMVLWVAIAALLALCATDRLDLGLETRARQAQATVVAAWEGLAPASAGPVMQTSARITTRPTASGGVTRATSSPSSPEPVSSLTPQPRSTGGSPAATPSPGPSPAPVSQPLPTAGAGEPAASPSPTPQGEGGRVETALVNTPLLLADPEIHTLTGMDAEMNRSAPGRAVQIRYQEEALNREIALLWQNNPELPFRQVVLDLQHGRVVIRGRATILGFEVQATVVGSVLIRDCQPQLSIESLSVAGVMTPRFVRDQVEDMILETMAWYPADYPLCLEQIVLEETRATIYGYHR